MPGAFNSHAANYWILSMRILTSNSVTIAYKYKGKLIAVVVLK
ncbi:hypothetical protein CRYPA_271 [uncultured Candidatus Thioglobus sp.]|nr:hypothetical protein CRYPA_271 [uncultured Candidatus Thioglobus sp.]